MVSKGEKNIRELIGKPNFEGYPAAAMKENVQKALPTYTKKSCKNQQTYIYFIVTLLSLCGGLPI